MVTSSWTMREALKHPSTVIIQNTFRSIHSVMQIVKIHIFHRYGQTEKFVLYFNSVSI